MKPFKIITTALFCLTLSQPSFGFGIITGVTHSTEAGAPMAPSIGIVQEFSLMGTYISAIAQARAHTITLVELIDIGGKSTYTLPRSKHLFPFTLDLSWPVTGKESPQSMRVGVWGTAAFGEKGYDGFKTLESGVYEFAEGFGLSLWANAADAEKKGGPGVRLSAGMVYFPNVVLEVEAAFLWQF